MISGMISGENKRTPGAGSVSPGSPGVLLQHLWTNQVDSVLS